MKGQCEVNGCNKPAKYGLFKTYPATKNIPFMEKKWLHVCESHEEEIGDENQKRAGEVKDGK